MIVSCYVSYVILNTNGTINESIPQRLAVYFSVTIKVTIEETMVEAGSGSLPTNQISSIALVLESKTISSNKISNKLRNESKIPILTYIRNKKVYIDLKAIPESQLKILASTINSCL